MSNNKKFTESQILKALKGSGGIKSTVAKRLGCTWDTANNAINSTDVTKRAFQDERETILDMAETTLLKSVQEGDVQSSKWMLSTLGKNRGYNEKTDIVITGDVTVLTPEQRKERIKELESKR